MVVCVADQYGACGIESDSGRPVDLTVSGALLAPVPDVAAVSVEHRYAIVVLVDEVQAVI